MEKPKHDFLGKKRLEEISVKLEDDIIHKNQASNNNDGDSDKKEE